MFVVLVADNNFDNLVFKREEKMNLDRNICSECGEKNFSDSEYHIPLSICNGCFEKNHKNMLETIDNLQKQVNNLEQEKATNRSDTVQREDIKNDNKGNKLIVSLISFVLISGFVFYFINGDKSEENKLQVEPSKEKTASTKVSKNIFYDNQTGLTWQDEPYTSKEEKAYYGNYVHGKVNTWSAAKEYCEDLTLDNKSDWRLPEYNELLSIVDYSRYGPAIKKGFKNVASHGYWSSSPYVSDDSDAWRVSFSSGNTDYLNKSSKYYVRCVRGRQ